MQRRPQPPGRRKRRPAGDSPAEYSFPANQRPDLCTTANVLGNDGGGEPESGWFGEYPADLFPRNCTAMRADRTGVYAVSTEGGRRWAWPRPLQRLHDACHAALSAKLAAHEGSAWLCGTRTLDQFGATLRRLSDMDAFAEVFDGALRDHAAPGRFAVATLPWALARPAVPARALYRITYARAHPDAAALGPGRLARPSPSSPKRLDAPDGPLARLPENSMCFLLFFAAVVVMEPVPPVPIYRLSRAATETEEPDRLMDALDAETGGLAVQARIDIGGAPRQIVRLFRSRLAAADLALIVSDDGARATYGAGAVVYAALIGARDGEEGTDVIVTVPLPAAEGANEASGK